MGTNDKIAAQLLEQLRELQRKQQQQQQPSFEAAFGAGFLSSFGLLPPLSNASSCIPQLSNSMLAQCQQKQQIDTTAQLAQCKQIDTKMLAQYQPFLDGFAAGIQKPPGAYHQPDPSTSFILRAILAAQQQQQLSPGTLALGTQPSPGTLLGAQPGPAGTPIPTANFFPPTTINGGGCANSPPLCRQKMQNPPIGIKSMSESMPDQVLGRKTSAAVEHLQISPYQLEQAMRQLIRMQQQQKPEEQQQQQQVRAVQREKSGSTGQKTPSPEGRTSIGPSGSGSDGSSSVAGPSPSPATEIAAASVRPTTSSSISPPLEDTKMDNGDDAEEEEGADEYVDVVGDGAQGRSSQMRFQRKAHIEFYRKLKAFRSRGPSLDCQQCGAQVANTDTSVRSHLHAHCRTAQFVCKLCQRGFQDQHLVFEHINVEHPTRKGTQCFEDRRDMNLLLQLLTDCFPRIVCNKARDSLHEHIATLLSPGDNGGDAQEQQQLQCALCGARVDAERGAICTHLNSHPAYRCKKCKFICTTEREQLDHQQAEHSADNDSAPDASQYCISVAFDVQLDTLRACFPLPEGASGTATTKGPKRKMSSEEEAEEMKQYRSGRKRKTTVTSRKGSGSAGNVCRKRKSSG